MLSDRQKNEIKREDIEIHFLFGRHPLPNFGTNKWSGDSDSGDWGGNWDTDCWGGYGQGGAD